MKLGKKILSAIILPVLGLSMVSCTSMTSYADADKYLIGSQTYTGELKTLDIDWISGQVTLIEDSTATSISVVEENDLPDEKKVHSYFHDGILNIKYWESGLRARFIDSSQKHLYVTYPSLENLDVDLTSGKLATGKITAKTVNVDLTSGSMDFDGITCDTINADLTSGSITINNLETGTGEFDCTSGSITIQHSKADSLSFDLTSGKIDLTIPEKGATVKFNKVSGSYHSIRENYTKNDNKYVYGDGSCQIKISVTSGKAYIR